MIIAKHVDILKIERGYVYPICYEDDIVITGSDMKGIAEIKVDLYSQVLDLVFSRN